MAPADGGAGAAERMKARAARLRDLSPVLKVFAEEIHKATDDAFDQSRSVDGKAFVPLAASTLEARGRRLKGGSRKSRRSGTKGQLTKRARGIRTAAAGSHKPLIDTARAKNSQRATIAGKNTLRWSAVGYLGPHITGATINRKARLSRAGLRERTSSNPRDNTEMRWNPMTGGFVAVQRRSRAVRWDPMSGADWKSMTKGGTITIPQRNPTVFNVDSAGKPTLKPRFAARLTQLVNAYVATGKVA